MSLILYKSNRLEILAHHLAERSLRPPLSSPFVGEQVIVQTQGMAQWLKLELSKRRGIVANVEFPFPRAFLSQLIKDLLPEQARAGAIDPEALTWRVMGRIEALLPQPAFSDIRNYLASSPDPRRKFQLAERVAALFDQYSIYRPEWIAAWQKGQETHWQAHLWRAAMTDGLACQGKFLHELMQALQSPGCEKSRLPERLSIFAPNNLPPIYLAVFAALARHVPVHLFCLCPCREYWGDTLTPGEAERVQAFAGDGDINPEDLHLEGTNPLLAAWGRTGRAFQRLVTDLEGIEEEVEDFSEPETSHLLGSIQSSILLLEDEAPKDREKVEVKRDDRSIQVHACHSPLRELQVLRDHLLEWFAADPTLTPQDVLVMLPDLEAYAPFVKGVFENVEPGAPAIPYTLADRGPRQESSLVAGFADLLQLASSRLTAPEVVDLFDTSAVRRRFGVAEEEISQIRQWIQNSSVRWGRDADHRARLGLPPFPEHTWEHGRGRLLLGYAMADGGDALVHDLLPCEGIEGTATKLLGQWLDFLQQLFAALDELSVDRTLSDWASTLNRLLDQLFLPDPAEELAANAIRQILDGLRQQQAVSEFDEKVSLAVVIERILPRFAEDQPGKAFLRGCVTFSGLNPMRTVPFRVVCLLGIQDGTFPRSPAPPSFDLVAQHPRTGDESRRDDDRYLFLETLLAARDRFYVSYIGRSVRDNSPRSPSVLVSELLDFIGSRYRLEGEQEPEAAEEPNIVNELLVTVHRLHGFSPTYFRRGAGSDPRYFGYSPALAKIAQFLADPASRSPAEPFLREPLNKMGEEVKAVTLGELQFFYRNPSRFFVEKRLEFRLPEDQDLLQEEEPFGVGGLEAFNFKQQILDSIFDQKPKSRLMSVWKGSGQLPPGPAGNLMANDMFSEAGPMADRLRDRVGQAQRDLRRFQLSVGPFKVEGQLAVFPGVGLVHYRAAKVDPKKKGEAHLKLWIEHLLLHLTGWAGPRCSYLIGEDGTWEFQEVPDAAALLRPLLDLYLQGLAAPLPFFPRSSFAYTIGPGPKTAKTAEDLAWEAWEGNPDDEFGQGEMEDPYFSLCFRNHPDPLGKPFQQLASAVARPLLNSQTEL
jgi:exodeoxyribonuclease V gamma subunit